MKRLNNSLFGLVFSASILTTGCGMMTIGGFELVDMRDSRYASDIRKKANELSENSSDPDNYARASELFGTVGDLEEMDNTARKFFEYSPERGLVHFRMCEKIHQYYEIK